MNFGIFKNQFESRLSRKSLLSSISSFLGSDVEIRADVLILFEVSKRILTAMQHGPCLKTDNGANLMRGC